MVLESYIKLNSKSRDKNSTFFTYTLNKEKGIYAQCIMDGENYRLEIASQKYTNFLSNQGVKNLVSLGWNLPNEEENLNKYFSLEEIINGTASKLIVASAGGFYGNTLDQKVDESDNVGTGFLAKTAEEWENSTFKFKLNKTSIIHTRFGLVLDKKEGAFPLISMPFKYGLGSYIGTGENWISWVSLLDTIKIYEYISVSYTHLTLPTNREV